MKISKEIADTLPPQFTVGDVLKFTFRKVVYSGRIADSRHVSMAGCDNYVLLRAIYGPLYAEKVNVIYGHHALGSWPCAKDTITLNVLFRDMQSRGCLIELV